MDRYGPDKQSMSNVIELKRWRNNDCTIGRLRLNDFQCFTLELPWKSNEQDISCIPEGTYDYYARLSPSNGNVLELRDVPSRTYIQIHSGNYTSQIQGCILVGDAVKWLNKDSIPDVTNSRATLSDLLSLAGQSGTIRVSW